MAADRVLAGASRISGAIRSCRYAFGLTGGIASGKSHARRVLGAYGAFTVDVDKIAWSVYEIGTPAYDDIVASPTFGESVLAEDGRIDRGKLGAKVFVSDAEPMAELNNIVWPRIPAIVQDHIQHALEEDENRKVIVLSDEWVEWADEVAVDVPAEFSRLCSLIDDSIAVATNTREEDEKEMIEQLEHEEAAAAESDAEGEIEAMDRASRKTPDPVQVSLRLEAAALKAKRQFLQKEVEDMNDPDSSSNFSLMTTPSAPDVPMLELVELPGIVAVIEAAVMVEAGWDRAMEEVWLCEVDEGEAIRRVMERDGVEEEAARARISKQARASERQSVASVVIDTTGSQRVTRWMLLREWTALVRRLQKQDVASRGLGVQSDDSGNEQDEEEDEEDEEQQEGGEVRTGTGGATHDGTRQ